MQKHENQFEIGLEAGKMQEILRREIVEENGEILINETSFKHRQGGTLFEQADYVVADLNELVGIFANYACYNSVASHWLTTEL